MNNLAYDPMTGQPVDPMAVRPQPQLTMQPMATTGMPAQPMAAQVPNPAVYNNARAIDTGVAMYGSTEMRQNSVMMTQAQEDAFGPGGHSENPGLYKKLK